MFKKIYLYLRSETNIFLFLFRNHAKVYFSSVLFDQSTVNEQSRSAVVTADKPVQKIKSLQVVLRNLIIDSVGSMKSEFVK